VRLAVRSEARRSGRAGQAPPLQVRIDVTSRWETSADGRYVEAGAVSEVQGRSHLIFQTRMIKRANASVLAKP
jgi:hypothetical protein